MSVLYELQKNIAVPKDKRNDFGKYNYRTAEGILSAAKAAMPDGVSIVLSDDVVEIGGNIFVKAKATLKLGTEIIAESFGFAGHPLELKGMVFSQITGSASSYARKYALQGLLAIDDSSADPDATNKHDGAPTGGMTPKTDYRKPAPPAGDTGDGPKLASDKQKGMIQAISKSLSQEVVNDIKISMGIKHKDDWTYLTSFKASKLIESLQNAQKASKSDPVHDDIPWPE